MFFNCFILIAFTEKDPGLFSLKIYHAGKFKYVDDKRKYVNGLVAYVDWCDIDKFSVHEIDGVMEKLELFKRNCKGSMS